MTAWMLRQDGAAFPLTHHVYAMSDDDLSSEAEVASFLLATNSADSDIAEFVLDCWMAKLIQDLVDESCPAEDIEKILTEKLKNLPYRFIYPQSLENLLAIHRKQNNFSGYTEFRQFLSEINSNLKSIQEEIKRSVNQQFCRVRYGGKYNTQKENKELWFRISSFCFDWGEIIHSFFSELSQKFDIETVSVCRDYESDHGETEGFPERYYITSVGIEHISQPLYYLSAEKFEHSFFIYDASFGNFFIHSAPEGNVAQIIEQLENRKTFHQISSESEDENFEINSGDIKRLYNREIRNCLSEEVVKKIYRIMDSERPPSKETDRVVGFTIGDDEYTVYIITDDSCKTPHFHINKSDLGYGFHSSIRLDKAEYCFHSEDATVVLNERRKDKLSECEKAALMAFLNSPMKIFDTRWKYAVHIWNSNNNDDFSGDMPDYSKL